MQSHDNGATWDRPKTVSFRAGRRDGMPVPLLLAGGKGIVLAIEDNGLNGAFKPVIIHTSFEDNWDQPFAGGDSPRRWGALEPPLPASVYAGAPYIRQLPGGETVLSVQSGEGRPSESVLDHTQMVVYVGDNQARGFTNKSVPFKVSPNASGL